MHLIDVKLTRFDWEHPGRVSMSPWQARHEVKPGSLGQKVPTQGEKELKMGLNQARFQA